MESNIINLNEYRLIKNNRLHTGYKKSKEHNICVYDDEERKKTLNLFIRVIETMKNESYK